MIDGIFGTGNSQTIGSRDTVAYDLSKNILTKVEVYDEEAINTSIENILLTIFSERIFIPSFGSALQLVLFDAITETDAVNIFSGLLNAIELWETRVIVDKRNAKLDFFQDRNTMMIQVPYVIKRNGIISNFKKNIIL